MYPNNLYYLLHRSFFCKVWSRLISAKDMNQLHKLKVRIVFLDVLPPSIDAMSSGASSLKESDSDHSSIAAVAGISKDISPKPRFDDIQLLASLQEEGKA